MIKGKKVILSTIEKKDIELIQSWRNSEKLKLYFREQKFLSMRDQENWITSVSNKNNHIDYFFKIALISKKEFIGVVGVNYINWINRNCQLSLYIGKNDYYIDKFGWANDALNLMEQYTFGVLNLHKIFCEVFEFDKKKLNVLLDNNYKKEAELEDHVFKMGKYYKSFILSKIKVQM